MSEKYEDIHKMREMLGAIADPHIVSGEEVRRCREYINDVLFEQLLSFRPQVAQTIFGREPCLRDIILHYYERNFTGDPDALTKKYIAKLHEKFAAPFSDETKELISAAQGRDL